ncbi:MAG TPA: sigma 54-interacting transcriptional regulator [Polyangia bacterium]|nr:sigma 54-interacting transcriptional regulator [Polyangia bacterium]
MPTIRSARPSHEIEVFPTQTQVPPEKGDTLPLSQGSSTPFPIRLWVDDGRQVWCHERLRIGSSSFNDLVLKDPYVSAQHCLIERKGPCFLLSDLGSRNGTFVAGARVTSAELQPGARLVIGRTGVRVLGPESSMSDPMIGQSPGMTRLRDEIARVAPTRASVLLLGESGTGKELAARAIHIQSGRRGEFVAINCGAIVADLVESELFGHERGAFTGAAQRRPGAFLEADGGTLFLDEIGEMSLTLQCRLLRVLETGKVRAVGASAERPVDVRIVAATHQDLSRRVAQGTFRLDLYHRLATVELLLPPLRERKADIAALAHCFLTEFRGEVGTRELSPEALAACVEYPWPGNIRELRNAIQRGVIMGGPVLQPQDLLPRWTGPGSPGAAPPSTPPPGAPPHDLSVLDGQRIVEVERMMIDRALRRSKGNRRVAAQELGMPKSTLCDKMRRYGISVGPGTVDSGGTGEPS